MDSYTNTTIRQSRIARQIQRCALLSLVNFFGYAKTFFFNQTTTKVMFFAEIKKKNAVINICFTFVRFFLNIFILKIVCLW